MNSTANLSLHKPKVISIVFDISALALIYLVPVMSHLVSLPLYLIEPMRLLLILAMVHTSRHNAYFLALTLPLFSFIISAHPVFPKMVLIAMELSLNVFLYYALSAKMKHIFPAVILSIVISKTVYYIVKFVLIRMLVIDSDLFSTPIYLQIITTIVFSMYCVFFTMNKAGKTAR